MSLCSNILKTSNVIMTYSISMTSVWKYLINLVHRKVYHSSKQVFRITLSVQFSEKYIIVISKCLEDTLSLQYSENYNITKKHVFRKHHINLYNISTHITYSLSLSIQCSENYGIAKNQVFKKHYQLVLRKIQNNYKNKCLENILPIYSL